MSLKNKEFDFDDKMGCKEQFFFTEDVKEAVLFDNEMVEKFENRLRERNLLCEDIEYFLEDYKLSKLGIFGDFKK